MERTVHCTTHCRSCGAHFSSTAAFDAHRKGPIDARYCEHPNDVVTLAGEARLGIKSAAGVCDVASPSSPQVGVTVWALAASLDGSAGRVAGLRDAA
jgi:hypothetical protein